MNDFFHELNFPIKIKQDLVLKTHHHYTVMDIKEFSLVTMVEQETIDFFKSKNLEISFARLFYSPPYTRGEFHLDGNINTDLRPRGSINFVLNNYQDWKMQWFNYPEDAPFKLTISQWGIKQDNVTVTRTTLLDFDRATLCSESSFKNACLVRTDIPHSVINTGPNHRFCVTIRFEDNDYYSILKKLS